MGYHIPLDSDIRNALETVLKKLNVVDSQNKLKSLVTEELNKKEDKFGVTGSRIRNIAISSNFVKVEIHSREGNQNRPITKCPVCRGSLKHVKNLTIWGGEVTIKLKCVKCNYWTGKNKRIPTRYIFHLKKKKS
jgi:uncharacterized protein with PIN domain